MNWWYVNYLKIVYKLNWCQRWVEPYSLPNIFAVAYLVFLLFVVILDFVESCYQKRQLKKALKEVEEEKQKKKEKKKEKKRRKKLKEEVLLKTDEIDLTFIKGAPTVIKLILI